MAGQQKNRKGFTLIELLVVIAIIALLIAILVPGLGEARRVARVMICSANLQQYGVGTQSYAADFQDSVWSFTWYQPNSGPGVYHMHDPWDHVGAIGLGNTSNTQWAARHAVWIMRHRGDRTGVRPSDNRQPITEISGWIPHFYYSHLVLNDYLAQRLPEPMVACPEDRPRRLWQSDPAAFDRGEFAPLDVAGGNASGGANTRRRWPYSSSYLPTVAAFESSPRPIDRIRQTQHGFVLVPAGASFGDRRLSDVAFPSMKVHQYDMVQRHFGRRQIAWVLEGHRQPLQFFDGSVSIRHNMDANKGERRNAVNTTAAQALNNQWPWLQYGPHPSNLHDFEPRPVTGAVDTGWGFYRFTANGLKGYDFGGVESWAPNRY